MYTIAITYCSLVQADAQQVESGAIPPPPAARHNVGARGRGGGRGRVRGRVQQEGQRGAASVAQAESTQELQQPPQGIMVTAGGTRAAGRGGGQRRGTVRAPSGGVRGGSRQQGAPALVATAGLA